MKTRKVNETSLVNNIEVALQTAKRCARRAEREVKRLERSLAEAKELERAERIKALLEANAERIVLIYCSFNEYVASKAKDIVIYQNVNKCWCLKIVGEENQREMMMEVVVNIFVEAEI